MNEFYANEHAASREQAMAFIASNVESMQQLYSEAVLMAREFDIRLHIDLELPESARGGHNQPLEGYWNASSQYC